MEKGCYEVIKLKILRCRIIVDCLMVLTVTRPQPLEGRGFLGCVDETKEEGAETWYTAGSEAAGKDHKPRCMGTLGAGKGERNRISLPEPLPEKYYPADTMILGQDSSRLLASGTVG